MRYGMNSQLKVLILLIITVILQNNLLYAQISVEDNNIMYSAQVLFDERKFDEAIKIYDAFISKNEKYVPAYILRGLAKGYAGNELGAIEDFTLAIKIDSNNYSALLNRGSQSRLLKEYKNSIEDYDRVIKIDSVSSRAWIGFENRGWVKHDAGDYEGAINDFTRSIYLNTKAAHSYYLRGLANQKLGNLEHACNDWKLARVYGFKYDNDEIERFCDKK